VTINITNLPAGSYDFYVYGPDAVYQMTVGGTDYGSKAVANAPISNPVVWQENVQYVVIRGVVLADSQAATLTVRPGAGGYAGIYGPQARQTQGGTKQPPGDPAPTRQQNRRYRRQRQLPGAGQRVASFELSMVFQQQRPGKRNQLRPDPRQRSDQRCRGL